jgi:hypothetical protein
MEPVPQQQIGGGEIDRGVTAVTRWEGKVKRGQAGRPKSPSSCCAVGSRYGQDERPAVFGRRISGAPTEPLDPPSSSTFV